MANFYSFTQAVTELQWRLGNRTDLGTGSLGRISLWLDAAQIKIASCSIACETLDRIAFPFNTTSGQSEYGLLQLIPPATDIIGIFSVRNSTQGVKMARFPWQEYRSLNQQAEGPPLRWARFGNTLALDPQPDSDGPYEILIDYRRNPTRGISELPNRFQDDWITVAEWIAWKALLKPERAAAAFSLLPVQLQQRMSLPLDFDQWDAMNDSDLGVRPLGFESRFNSGWS